MSSENRRPKRLISASYPLFHQGGGRNLSGSKPITRRGEVVFVDPVLGGVNNNGAKSFLRFKPADGSSFGEASGRKY